MQRQAGVSFSWLMAVPSDVFKQGFGFQLSGLYQIGKELYQEW